MAKTIWIINQYANIPPAGAGGRHPELARELAKLGHRVTLIAARWSHLITDTQTALSAPAKESVGGFHFLRLSTAQYRHAHDKRRILSWFHFAWKLAKLGAPPGQAPDIILYSSPSLIGFLGAERLARKYNAKLVFEVRDIWPLSLRELGGFSPQHPFIQFLQWVEDRAYQKSDAVISNLPGAIEHMTQRGMEREKFTWVPNGFAREHVEERLPLPPEIAAQLPRDTFNVCYAGTLGTANALHILLNAAKLLAHHEGITFTLVGQGHEKAKLQEQARNLKLSNVVFLDPVPKKMVQSVLHECSVCYIGLTSDPLFRFGVSPNKLFDYLVSGKPVIYGIDSGAYRPVEEFGAGIHIPPQDPQALADAIAFLKSKAPDELQKMGQNGKRMAYSLHEYGTLAARLEQALI